MQEKLLAIKEAAFNEISAAENSGALAVLNDFVNAIKLFPQSSGNEWYIFTSVADIEESDIITKSNMKVSLMIGFKIYKRFNCT